MKKETQERQLQKVLNSFTTGDDCWEWNGYIDCKGYGGCKYNGRTYRAHRAVYEIMWGEIPEGLVLDHLCRNHKCVNPMHLEAVTDRENILRGIGIGAMNKRKTHCSNGHELSGTNIKNKPSRLTTRVCRTCKREEGKRYQRRKRLQLLLQGKKGLQI